MAFPSLDVPALFDLLEAFHGPQQPRWPCDPYSFLIWWHCGYPASDAVCERGWQALQALTGIEPEQLLACSQARLAAALKAGGMVPELRALRLHQIAERVVKEFGGDLRRALGGEISAARRALKKFPGIADPGVDRILLFGHIAPLAAIPSNCPHVLVRIRAGLERENYGVNYREAQAAVQAAVPADFAAREHAYLLLKVHGQTLCKRTGPKCASCPVRSHCAYFAGNDRGGRRPPLR